MRKKMKKYFVPHQDNDYLPYSVREKFLRTTLIFGLLIVILTFVGTSQVPANSQLAQVQARLLTQLTNKERHQEKIGALKINPRLQKAAELKAKDMIKYGYFAHTSPKGKTPWYWFNKAGYKYRYAGENLASDYYDTREVTEAWMHSPLHKKNILNPKYTEIGIAVETGTSQGRKVAYVVQMFGSPRFPKENDTLVPENNNQASPTVLAQNDEAPDEQQREVLGEEDVMVSGKNSSYIETEFSETNEGENAPELENTTTTESEAKEPQANPSATKVSDYSEFEYALAQPGIIGKLGLLALIGILGIALMLKIVIEYRKQHYWHIVYTFFAIVVLLLAYYLLSIYLSQVIIV